MSENSVNVYYCGLCETSHPFLKEGTTCPGCGRKYCLDSIKASQAAGVNQCPYCQKSFSEFAELKLISPYAKFCASCGTENTNNQKFCINCGKNLDKNKRNQTIRG